MRDEVQEHLPELTLRGLALGAAITVLFTAANVYLGLKIGLTFASSIPAAVISMAVLRLAGGASILENNIVQTEASAAGTLSSIIMVMPALVMVGLWHGFPYWQGALVCLAGGVLGVLFTIPLRRAMVVDSGLPYPEGVAAAEILRVGAGTAVPGEPGAADIAAGGIVAAVFSFAAAGLHILTDGISLWTSAGSAIFRLSTGFSLALLGAGYLIGIQAGLAMLLGAVLSWGVAVPILTTLHPAPPGADIAAYATTLWAQKVRFIGAGVIGIAAIWSLLGLAGPTLAGIRSAIGQAGLSRETVARTEQDLDYRAVIGIFAASCIGLALLLWWFVAGAATFSGAPVLLLVLGGTVFAALFGFLVAAACGYMAGLVGSSSSPISGIGILATIAAGLLLLGIIALFGAQGGQAGQQAAKGFVLFTVTAVLATASISNNNLQDLKTGQLVGATPWRQQVALLIGCVAGALVIPPILDLLYQAYGFPDALPHAGMNPANALPAPQATLMAKIAAGILGGTLQWTFIYIGAALSVAMILVDTLLKRMGGAYRLPVLAVGIGLYLPPTVGVTLAIGATVGWIISRRLRGRADAERADRRGVLIASGFIVGESLVGVAMAGIIGASGSQAPLQIVPDGFETAAQWLSLAAFAAVAVWFARRVLKTR